MSDWVSGSTRMKWLAGASMATWLAAVIFALVAQSGHNSQSSAAAVLLICSFAMSGPLMIWSAFQLPRRSWLRRAWGLIVLGVSIKLVFLVAAIVSHMLDRTSSGPFQTGAQATMWGYLPIIAGILLAAWSLRKMPELRLAVVRSVSLPILLFLLFLAAMIAPGPSMPFDFGPRDSVGVARLAIDMLLVFMPAVFCVAAALQLPNGHRARSWMWLAIGALMWGMSDVVFPLVDLRYGQVYPIMLWALGVHLMAMGISLAVDFERAERHS